MGIVMDVHDRCLPLIALAMLCGGRVVGGDD